MFAVYAAEPSPDDPIAALRVGDRPEPEVPDGWVAVRVRAASLNMHDLWTLRGVGIKPDQFPMILGCDGAGTLDDGSEVVIHSVINAPGWQGDDTLDPKRTLLTEKYQGTFADQVVVPARNVVPKPGGIIVVSGSTSGPDANAELQRVFFLQLRVAGSTMGTRDELADLLAYLDLTGVRPQIGAELPFAEAPKGFQAMLEGDTAGK